MSCRKVTILALICGATAVSPAIAAGHVVLAAQEIEVAVAPQPADQRLVGLPPIEFALRAAIQCKGDAVSLTLSIADTFKTIGRALLEDQRSASATLTVPAQQMALAASSRFCIDGDNESADELLVPGFATAYASLRCAHEERASAHFGSTALQLRLSCARAPEEPQESSESSTDR